MSDDLSGLNLSMVNEEELRLQVAATVASRTDQAALADEERVKTAWSCLQDQERAVESLEAALEEAKRVQAVRVVVGTSSAKKADTAGANTAVVCDEAGDALGSVGGDTGNGKSLAPAAMSVSQLQFQLARARRELKRAGTELDDAQKRAAENQRARYELARQQEIAESEMGQHALHRAAAQGTTPAGEAGWRGRAPVPLTFAQRQAASSLAPTAPGDVDGGAPQSAPSASPARSSSVLSRESLSLAPARHPLAHLRGITREAYSGGDVLPSLARVHVSRADIRAKHLRYEDDSDEQVYHARVVKRRRLELVAALQQHAQHHLEQKEEEDVKPSVKPENPSEAESQVSQRGAIKVEEGLVDSDRVATSAPQKQRTAQGKPAGAKAEASGVPNVKAEVLSPSPARQRASSCEVIDVDALMEAEEAPGLESGSLAVEALQTLLDASRAAVREADFDANAASPPPLPRASRKRTRLSAEQAEADKEKSDELWERVERMVASQPDLPIHQDVQVLPGLRLAKSIYDNLLDYQKEGVRWLLHLHGQRSGGILGDEMGLGKTIQIAAMLNALHASQQLRGPALIVAPTTVLRQWVAELHRWAPYVRVCVMHESAGDASHRSRETLIRSVRGTPAVVITTYAALRTHCQLLHSAGFQYLIVDEGHKLSNPEAAVTLAAKSFATPHRLILSGSPIQNTLKELWCLFDLIRPGLLGTLSTFIDEFDTPISQSKNVRASPLALATAMECAKTLQAHIAPYLLRRLKRQVNASLPPKVERVIRVPLTDAQLAQYVDIVSSPGVQRLFSQTLFYPQIDGGPLNRDGRDSTGSLHVAGRRFNLQDARRRNTAGVRLESFRVMNQLRQVCNHADIYAVQKGEQDGESEELKVARRAAAPARAAAGRSFRSNNAVNVDGSAKLLALKQMLREWHRFGHRVLVFSQTRMMLDIIENLCEQENHRYIRLDGTTNSHHRQELIDRFNSDESIFVALLTTRVGGVGVNLTGADRVVIFDPDWNPVTDIQARERAWRIGQTREVCVYRMICSGTVEEAILRRQLAKTYVTDKVLRDPTLQRFFHIQESFVENFLLGAEYAPRVPLGKRHVLGSSGADTTLFSGRVHAGRAERRTGEARQPPVASRDNMGRTTAAVPTTTGVRTQEVEQQFGVEVHLTRDEEGSTHGEEPNGSDSGETGLLKKLIDGQDVAIDGKDGVSRHLARAKARSMMQRVAEDGRTRSAEAQQREFSLMWAAQQQKEKDMADRAEQRRYFEEEMARKRRGQR